ncbi:hypothetical protein F4553_001133 [Allocatelliglobosispora scoriae]|uniref:Uncharacterized protein n=1 Tax=Allocatelliglobosispora scoriae TaxID=643052 RepID=A0A841BHI9_9ACTN|nr:hypothetical protein [Allocatelliglobosispora scoriae]MBB5867754.1 hypothetical protein [Allocatelliglobosispora scoriae]
MNAFVFAAPVAPADPPLLLTIAVWSTLVLLVVLGATGLTYQQRHRFERADRLVQRLTESEYAKRIQGPVVALILAAMSGFGINVLTDQGWHGYLGFLLAMPLPVAYLTWSGIRAVRADAAEGEWPPTEIPPGNRVRVRGTLRRAVTEGADLATADLTVLLQVVATLLEQTEPALRGASRRSTARWLRDHPVVTSLVLSWAAGTVGCVLGAALSYEGSGGAGRVAVPAGFLAVVLAAAVGLLAVLSRHSRFKDEQLADEVSGAAGELRGRIREHLFLPAGAARRRPDQGRDGFLVP